jgi:anti-anti-sigma factor
MSISILTRDDITTIQLEKDFTFHHQAEFRKSYEQNLEPQTKSILIDFGKTDFIDSAALGMLLILREYIEKHGQSITIKLINCKKEVLEILEISNFAKLFSIQNSA